MRASAGEESRGRRGCPARCRRSPASRAGAGPGPASARARPAAARRPRYESAPRGPFDGRVYRYNLAVLVPRSAPTQAPGKPRRRIRKLRLLGLLLILFVLGLLSFAFGLVTSIATEIPSLDPGRLQQREVDGFVYDRRGHRILAVLRGSQSRILVTS